MNRPTTAPLISARAFSRLVAAGVYSQRITFQQLIATAPDAFGQQSKALNNYSDVTGYIAIPCAVAPEVLMAPSAGNLAKTGTQTGDKQQVQAKLAGLYRDIDKKWRAIITDPLAGSEIAYQVMSAENDSRLTFTWLRLEVFKL